MKTKLEKIAIKYSALTHNENNFYVGGGLDNCKFASNRHEDANNDKGKLTFGKAVQLFKSATDCEIDFIKSVMEFIYPNMEWHHAGMLPKSYGGGMKKTYFLNAEQIVNLANNWEQHSALYNKNIKEEKIIAEAKKLIEFKRQEFLNFYATKVIRDEPKSFALFYETNKEMQGKYGWFDYDSKYKLDVYYTGWQFASEEKFNEFFKIN